MDFWWFLNWIFLSLPSQLSETCCCLVHSRQLAPAVINREGENCKKLTHSFSFSLFLSLSLTHTHTNAHKESEMKRECYLNSNTARSLAQFGFNKNNFVNYNCNVIQVAKLVLTNKATLSKLLFHKLY